MPRVLQTRKDLKDYILRRLGYPTYNVELSTQVLDDIINETIDKFIEIAHSGTQIRFATLDLETNKKEYQLSDNVVSILTVFDNDALTTSGYVSDPFSINNFIANDVLRRNSGKGFCRMDLVNYEVTMQFLETLKIKLKQQILFDFNTITKTLYILSTIANNTTVGLLYYEMLEYDVSDSEVNYLYDNRFIKKYATELARKEWGLHLMKYGGSLLPNGLQINYNEMIDRADSELEKLETELEEKYQLPIDFFVG